jgi:hypothetical protein
MCARARFSLVTAKMNQKRKTVLNFTPQKYAADV